ncbi:hypothetical protein F5Y14DRAFT_419877 [Nemania sp. NC0429]|nr:hypothetical protein F5Y14DRAFT_419877 [Nemania sp. NC0429]
MPRLQVFHHRYSMLCLIPATPYFPANEQNRGSGAVFAAVPSLRKHAAPPANGLNRYEARHLAVGFPLRLVIYTSISLRLVSYMTSGKNFTFKLAEPDRICRYVRDPDHASIIVLPSTVTEWVFGHGHDGVVL